MQAFEDKTDNNLICHQNTALAYLLDTNFKEAWRKAEGLVGRNSNQVIA